MIPRIKPIKLKLIIAIFIDVFLFFTLLIVGYALFFIPARAEIMGDPTETPVPSETFTLEPSQTYTLEPSATITSEPSPTNTFEPSATSTSEPSPTNTFEPSATSTPEPSATPTLEPSNTPTNTIEPSLTPSPTNTPPPDKDTPEPSPTYKLYAPTQKATSTPEVFTCPACSIVKDFRELIISGLYTADLLNTEDISSTLKVSITLYNGYKGEVVGNTISMIDTQPANEIMHVETPLWCISPSTGEVYWIHTKAFAQNSSGNVWFVIDEWVQINLSDDRVIEPSL